MSDTKEVFCPIKPFCLAVLLTAAIVSAADVSYFGKWRLNPSKSQFGYKTVTWEKTPSGDYRWTSQGGPVNFSPDGKEYPWPTGGTVSAKTLGPDVLELTFRPKGVIEEIVTFTLRGDTISQVATVQQTGLTTSYILRRVSGGPGFPGEWQQTEANPPAYSLELAANGADGLVMRYNSELISGNFDGKAYAWTGVGDGGPKSTMAFRRTGPGSFEATPFIDGNPSDTHTFTVSADGNVLTETWAPKKEHSEVRVFERQ